MTKYVIQMGLCNEDYKGTYTLNKIKSYFVSVSVFTLFKTTQYIYFLIFTTFKPEICSDVYIHRTRESEEQVQQ